MAKFSAVLLGLMMGFASFQGLEASSMELKKRAGGPIEMVVGLIEELRDKLVADEDAEQKIYNKFACWCETTSARKAKDIEKAKEDIERLGNKVLQLKGAMATLEHEIAELTKDIAENEEAQAEATSLRTKENSEFMASKTELEQAISAMERAIIVLGKGTKLLQADQKTELGEVLKDVKLAVKLLPLTHNLAPAKEMALSAFLTNPGSSLVQADSSSRAPSDTIIGILRDMYDTFSADLETQTTDEATSQKNFEDLIATKAEQMQTLQDTLAKKEQMKADTDKNLADHTQELEDTTNKMKEDTKFFDEMKASCAAKAKEWEIRSSMRMEELEGIKKALEILTSDEARAIFQGAIKPGAETFLQMDMESSNSMDIPRNKAYMALKRAAGKSKSLRLASLAATLKSSGAFKVVIDEIDKMMQALKDEEAADIEQRDWCKEETFNKEQEKARYEYKIEKTEAKIVKLTEKKEELEDSLVATIAEIAQTHEEITDMESTREEEHSAFVEAKDMDGKAIKLLNMAIKSMSGGANKDVEAFLQGKEPEFAVDPDQAPDATFSDAGSRKGESKGIVSILTMLVEDLEAEIKNGVKDEDAAQAGFEKAVHTAKALIETLESRKANLEEEHAQTVEKIQGQEKVQEETQGLLDAVKEELASMKPNCDWLLGAFDHRREKRKMEMEGLFTAKSYLSGAQPGAASLLQAENLLEAGNAQAENLNKASFLQRKRD